MSERDTMPPGDAHRRPEGVTDATVEALGKLGEALEMVERARGALYEFHQLSGGADLALGEAADLLDKAGHTETAEGLRAEVIGRNVIEGRWTFQIVEDYDDGYYAAVRAAEDGARQRHGGGIRHLYEAEMKERRRTHGLSGHESRPDS
jgi:hypothetical protein